MSYGNNRIARNVLRKYIRAKQDVETKRATIEQLRLTLIACGIDTTHDSVQTSHTDRMAATIAKIVDMQKSLDAEIEQLVDVQNEIIRAIGLIPQEAYKAVLTYRYIRGYSWLQISIIMKYSEDHVKGWLHGMALQEFARVYECDGE